MLILLGLILVVVEIVFFTIWGTVASLVDLILPLCIAFFIIAPIIAIVIGNKKQKEKTEEALRQYENKHPNVLRTITPQEQKDKKHFRGYDIESVVFLTGDSPTTYFIAKKNGNPYFIAKDLMVLKGKIVDAQNINDEKKALAKMVKQISKEQQYSIIVNKLKYFVVDSEYNINRKDKYYYHAAVKQGAVLDNYDYVAPTEEALYETVIINEAKVEDLILTPREKTKTVKYVRVK